ncbi:MAG: DMT family transporter [Planctomycetaceae bacterium]|nr:DMT family transporter [Planctomycetaceae bacterium]
MNSSDSAASPGVPAASQHAAGTAVSDHSTAQQTMWSELSLVGVAFIWGINIPIMKNGLDQMNWYGLNAIRLVFSASVLALLGWREFRGGTRPAKTLKKSHVFAYAVIVSGLYQFLFLLGISRTTSANTSLIISTIPMWTALAARVFLKEKLRPLAWFALTIAFVGTVVVALQKTGGDQHQQSLIGNLCIIGAALGWSAGTVISRPLLKSISPMQLSAWSATIALPFHLAVAAPWLSQSVQRAAKPELLAILLYSGVFSTGLALPMWSFGVRHSGAARASAFQNLVPLIAIASAWLIRGESVGWAQLAGGGMIIGGLVLIRMVR